MPSTSTVSFIGRILRYSSLTPSLSLIKFAVLHARNGSAQSEKLPSRSATYVFEQ